MWQDGMIVAYTADPEDEGTDQDEGSYYLALVKGPAFPVPQSQVHASDRFEAGWLVVKAQWYELQTTSPRCYKLQTTERLLVVNEMIRLSGLQFEKVQRASRRLGESRGALLESSLHWLSEDTHNMIEACVRDQNSQWL